MAYTPWFPDPGSYIRYYDPETREVKYRKLTWRRDPLKYPYRMPRVSAGSKSDPVTFDELNPSANKRHVYLAYLGVSPGFSYYLFHPFDIKTLKWDENITDILEDLVANITYEDSPYEFPTKAIGIDRDRYPAIEAKNLTGATATPQVIWIASVYRVVQYEELTDDERSKLATGAIKSYPWDFGGEL